MPEQKRYDIAIIGAGIVGLATAMELLTRFPPLCLVAAEASAPTMPGLGEESA